ncbi:condensation domain-containing protein [Micromonospora sp. NPDC048871]|uniref:condensation domain-containing protein n=1 Tax=unclassified Micromonospora TaxID=2617518 RepID=UPI002E131FC3|nr:condensation domain-containing protein [Micromonospora sp. NBC_01739]
MSTPGDRVGRIVDAVLGTAATEDSLSRLGVTSLDLLRVCAELEHRTGITLSLADVMTAPTVTALAEHWRNGGVPVLPHQTGAGIPLTSLARGCLLRQLVSPADIAGNCILLWTLDGPVHADLLAESIMEVQQRHELLRCAYTLRGGAVPAGPPVAPARMVAETAAEALARCQPLLTVALRPAAGEVFRSVVVSTPTGAVIGLVAHHVAFDGYSESVVAADLGRAYRARLDRRPVDWPAAPDGQTANESYRRQRAAGDLDRQGARVRAALSGATELRFPGATGSRTGREASEKPAVLTAALAPVPAVSVAMAAYARAVGTVTGQRDISFVVPVNRRGAAGLDLVVGNFVEMLPVRIMLPAAPDPAGDLTATATAWASALSRQDLDFEEVVRAAGSARHIHQHVFALQNNPAPRIELPGTRARFVRSPYPALANRTMTEIWPAGSGYSDTTDTAVFSYGPGWIGAAEAAALLTGFRDNLRRYAGRQPAPVTALPGVCR